MIPTGNFPLSVGLGAFTALGVLISATPLPQKLYGTTLVMSPFLCGFLGNVAYGAVASGRSHILPVGFFSFLLFYFLLFCGLLSGLFWELGLHRRELDVLAKFTLHPFTFVPALAIIFVPAAATAMIGGIFGWLAGLAIRR
jgi:hypothetical protein